MERVELSTPFEGGLYLDLYRGQTILHPFCRLPHDAWCPRARIVLEHRAQRTVWAIWAITELKHLVSNSRCKIFMRFDRSVSGRSRLAQDGFGVSHSKEARKIADTIDELWVVDLGCITGMDNLTFFLFKGCGMMHNAWRSAIGETSSKFRAH